MVDLHGGSMNGSTFIEFSMAQKKLNPYQVQNNIRFNSTT